MLKNVKESHKFKNMENENSQELLYTKKVFNKILSLPSYTNPKIEELF